MSNFETLKTEIVAAIYPNGVEAIDGQTLQDVLLDMVDALGNDYALAGAATPTTIPPTPDSKTAYVATTSGTFTYFIGQGGTPVSVPASALSALLTYDPTAGYWVATPFGTLAAGSIGTNELADGAVTTPKLADSAVTGNKLSNGAVSNANKLASNVVTTAKIASNAVTTAKIADFSVTINKLNSNSVSSEKMTPNAVTPRELAPASVSGDKIADGGIPAGKLDNNSVATGNIQDEAVTAAKIAPASIGMSHINSGALDNVPTSGSDKLVKSGGVSSALGAKQDTIADLATIREGAELGATAYQKPSGGIPKSDLSAAVQTSLGKADTALQSPIHTADIADGAVPINKIAPASVDATPTNGSDNLVKSGGVHSAIQAEQQRAITAETGLDSRLQSVEGLAQISIDGGTAQVVTDAANVVSGSAGIPTAGAVADFVAPIAQSLGKPIVIGGDGLTRYNVYIPSGTSPNWAYYNAATNTSLVPVKKGDVIYMKAVTTQCFWALVTSNDVTAGHAVPLASENTQRQNIALNSDTTITIGDNSQALYIAVRNDLAGGAVMFPYMTITSVAEYLKDSDIADIRAFFPPASFQLVNTPTTAGNTSLFFPKDLYAGRTYKLHIEFNGLTINPLSTYACVIRTTIADHVESGTDPNIISTVLTILTSGYTGAAVDVVYTATQNSTYIQFYIGRADHIGDGVVMTITEEGTTSIDISSKIDDTLTEDGMAADAGAVGKALCVRGDKLFYGRPIDLRQHKFTIKDVMTAHVGQGMDIADGVLFRADDGGTCWAYDFAAKSSVALGSFPFGSAQTGLHCNAINFGVEIPTGATYPALYVTTGNPNSPVDNVCHVEAITNDGNNNFTSATIQCITLDRSQWEAQGFMNIWGAPHWMVDKERGFLWVFSAKLRTIKQATGAFRNNTYVATQFRLPLLSEGDLTFTADDIIRQVLFDFDTYFTQGGTMHDGKIYYCFGTGDNDDEPTNMRVYDTDDGSVCTKFYLRKYIPFEPEDISIYEGGLYLAMSSGKIYQFDF